MLLDLSTVENIIIIIITLIATAPHIIPAKPTDDIRLLSTFILIVDPSGLSVFDTSDIILFNQH
jgi:hypothetical protein